MTRKFLVWYVLQQDGFTRSNATEDAIVGGYNRGRRRALGRDAWDVETSEAFRAHVQLDERGQGARAVSSEILGRRHGDEGLYPGQGHRSTPRLSLLHVVQGDAAKRVSEAQELSGRNNVDDDESINQSVVQT